MRGGGFSPAPRGKSLCSRYRLGFSNAFPGGQFTWYTVLRNDIQGFVPNPFSHSSSPYYEMWRAT